MLWKVTTQSGAVYYVEANGKVTGGSKSLASGQLFSPIVSGRSMVIYTPERARQNPTAEWPSVFTTPVVSVEGVDDSENE